MNGLCQLDVAFRSLRHHLLGVFLKNGALLGSLLAEITCQVKNRPLETRDEQTNYHMSRRREGRDGGSVVEGIDCCLFT